MKIFYENAIITEFVSDFRKVQNSVLGLFGVMQVVLVSLLLTLDMFHIFFWCFIVDFEQVNASWDYSKKFTENRFFRDSLLTLFQILLKPDSNSVIILLHFCKIFSSQCLTQNDFNNVDLSQKYLKMTQKCKNNFQRVSSESVFQSC